MLQEPESVIDLVIRNIEVTCLRRPAMHVEEP